MALRASLKTNFKMKELAEIPPKLYRGDADSKGIRMLKETIHFGQLQTNLINGGEGRVIMEKPLQELINEHVGIGWNKTHFLSFSSSITTALGYGASVPGDKTFENELEYDEYYDNDSSHDFILLTLHTDKAEWVEIGSGIYEGLYSPSLLKFSLLVKQYRVILINVEEVLRTSANNDYQNSVANAVST